ncbi:MAG: purine-nucleoside phosphorylase [Brevinematia bacterium]
MKVKDYKKLKKAKERFLKLSGQKSFDLAIILGSGLGDGISEIIDVDNVIDFSDIPYLEKSGVGGHRSRIYIGRHNGKSLIVQCGRLHLYEGFSPFEVSFPVAIYGEMGIGEIIITNAAGGINREFSVGDIMLISDHINLQGENVLIEFCNDDSRFIDMSRAYSVDCYPILKEKYNVKKGVYIGVKGPSFETSAEIRAFEKLGADAVGMSTIQEVILANYYGMKVTALSLITNMASGIGERLSHDDVLKTGEISKESFYEVIKEIIKN